MDYLLERKVKINRNTEFKNLYAWCLNEFDENQKQVGRDWVPFEWRFWFTGTSLQVTTNLSISRDMGNGTSKVSSSKTINGKFFSGICVDDKNLIEVVTFSIFGTARTISEFTVTINEASEGSDEACWFIAFPSYEYEDSEFRKVIEDDFAGFEIQLNTENFNNLVKIIESRSIDSVSLSVKNIDGVYADWTPTIVTHSAKLLTSKNTIDDVEKSKFEGTFVTKVEEFNINFRNKTLLQSKQSSPSVDFHKEFEDKFDLDYAESTLSHTQSEVKQSDFNTQPLIQAVKSIKIAVWFVFAALILLLSK